MRWLLILVLSLGAARAQDNVAGQFDYYVLSLSWSPNWCALEGDRRNSRQCAPDKDFGWVLHGLWPQYEQGWPSFCATSARNPRRSETRQEADIYGTSGSAWHQWNKHGRCTGMTSEDYYALARDAYARVERPEIFRKLKERVRVPAEVVEEAFLEANPHLSDDEMAVTCKDGHIQEIRICLTKWLEPRRCGDDVIRDCQMTDALFEPIK